MMNPFKIFSQDFFKILIIFYKLYKPEFIIANIIILLFKPNDSYQIEDFTI